MPDDSDSEAGCADSADEKAATEHYVDVGKSKLRRKERVALGSRYKGARISRADLEAQDDDDDDDEEEEEEEVSSDNFESAREDLDGASSEYDDPENADFEADQARENEDAEIDSDNALGEGDEEKFKDFSFRGSSQTLPHRGKRVARPTAADFISSDDDEEDEGSEDALVNGLEDDDEEDDDGDDLDSEDEEELLRRNDPAAAFLDDEAEESDEDEDGDEELDGFIDDDEQDSEGDSENDEDEDEDQGDDNEESDGERKAPVNANATRATLQDMIQAGQRSVAESLSSAAQKDVAKGKAVRQQQKAFDALLNIRIRLQKSLVAVNSLAAIEDAENQSEPYEAAEAAAVKLWNSIDGFRSSIQSATAAGGKPSQKRKRALAVDATTPSQDIWDSMEETERRAKVRRRAVLENWSQKARNMRTVDRSTARNKFTAAAAEKPLTARLDEELLQAPERLVRRTRTPRSCAPLQVARKVNEDARIYDDADFYQLLLKELVDQRSADTSNGGGGADGVHSSASAAATVRFTAAAAAREAKAKRHVDTKASKGRKMRFNVHEKLQNFMAPEDRRTWEESAIDRLFGTLFGQRMVLDEDVDGEEDGSDQEMGGVEFDEGLRLFRS